MGSNSVSDRNAEILVSEYKGILTELSKEFQPQVRHATSTSIISIAVLPGGDLMVSDAGPSSYMGWCESRDLVRRTRRPAQGHWHSKECWKNVHNGIHHV